MYRRYNNPIYKTVVVVWLTLSIASVILATITWFRLSKSLQSTREAVAIQNELDAILKVLLVTESSQLGFTITGDENYLESLLDFGDTNLTSRFERLAELIKQDSLMLSQVIEFRAQSELFMKHHQQIVKVRKEQGEEAAAKIIVTGEGKTLMDDIRARMRKLRGMRWNLLSDNGAAARTQLLRASLTSLVAGILGVGAGIFAFWLARVMLGHQQREKQLVEEKLRAERSSQEKTDFLANMSHEIRTPMNSILGFSELLANELSSPKHKQYLQSIRVSAGSLLQLINDVLDMSKFEAGVMELRIEPSDPREICDFLQSVFSESAAKKGVKLVCNVAEDLPRALLLDRIRLRQILVNLVGNAIKFTEDGIIEVRVQWEQGESSSHITLLIEVSDTGVGISPAELDAIFKPFFQTGAHRERERSGTGLGLSIVKRLTEMMEGTITVASVEGQGSAFSLRFPQVPISLRLAVDGTLDADLGADFNKLQASTLLVVDDSEVNCQLVAGMFSGSHHRLVFCSSGREAVKKARSLRPDAILLDIRMPDMDGHETLAEIRKCPGLELTPVLAVTASSLMDEEGALKSQFSGYVRKPFSQRQLFKELSHFLPPHEEEDDGLDAETSSVSNGDFPVVPVDLLDALRRLATDEWPGIRDSLAINESKDFAAKLHGLDARWPCPPLARYAQALTRHAENYAVEELEMHLVEFPALLEHLERHARVRA